MKFLIFTCFLIAAFTLSLNAQVTKAEFRRGEQLEKAGKTAEAIEAFTKCIQADSMFQNAYLKRSFLLISINNHEAAISDFSRILRINPNHSWSLLSRGSAYLKLGFNELALQDFDTVIELEPENSEAYNNRGWARRNIGDIDGACNDWKKSKKLGNQEAKIILENSGCK